MAAVGQRQKKKTNNWQTFLHGKQQRRRKRPPATDHGRQMSSSASGCVPSRFAERLAGNLFGGGGGRTPPTANPPATLPEQTAKRPSCKRAGAARGRGGSSGGGRGPPRHRLRPNSLLRLQRKRMAFRKKEKVRTDGPAQGGDGATLSVRTSRRQNAGKKVKVAPDASRLPEMIQKRGGRGGRHRLGRRSPPSPLGARRGRRAQATEQDLRVDLVDGSSHVIGRRRRRRPALPLLRGRRLLHLDGVKKQAWWLRSSSPPPPPSQATT